MAAIDQLLQMIRSGMRNVTLPESAPVRVEVVIEYPQTIVRHEIKTQK